MSLSDTPLDQFLADLASAEPVPGGGSVAALAGALAASLLSMVCRLTIGKKGYEGVEAEMQSLLARVTRLESSLRDLMQADIDAYAGVMHAYQRPKSTETERASRALAVQGALEHASEVPLAIARQCLEVILLARAVADKGNKNAASDAGVGVLMAQAGLRGALLNVNINLGSIKNQEFVRSYREQASQFASRADREAGAILAIVEGRL